MPTIDHGKLKELADAVDNWEYVKADADLDGLACIVCGINFSVPYDLEPTAVCNTCAHELAIQFARGYLATRAAITEILDGVATSVKNLNMFPVAPVEDDVALYADALPEMNLAARDPLEPRD